jgi:hypothetical protein
MLYPTKQVFAKYEIVVVRMHDDLHIMVVAKTNFQYLCDFELMMGLAWILLLLELVHVLIKFVQAHVTFVCDFVTIVKIVLC